MASYRVAYRPLSRPVNSVAPCSLRGTTPTPEAKGPQPQPCLQSPEQRPERMPISPDSWRLLNPANYFFKLLLQTEIWAGLCKFQGRLLSAAYRHPGASEGRVLVCRG